MCHPCRVGYSSFFGFLLSTVHCLLPTVYSSAQSDAPQYRIERDQVEKDGKIEDRFFVARQPDASGKAKLYVAVHFKVLQPDGTPALDIMPDDIVVKEDGRRVVDMEVQTPSAGEPLTAILAIDISGSMAEHGKMEEAKQAARLFLDRLDQHSQAGLILFDHKTRLQEPPTADLAKLRSLIDAAEPSGGTAYLDATAEAIEMLLNVKGRKAVLVMTDGVDLNSKRKVRDVVELARSAQVPVYTVGVGEAGKNTSVSTVLVLDQSGSMRRPADDEDASPKIQALKRAASRFVDVMRPGARTTLLPFNDEVPAPKPLSADREDLKIDIAQLRPNGGTRLYDAAFEAVETLDSAGIEGRKSVVVLTDGVDEEPGSRHSANEVIALAKAAQIPLHMLGFGRHGEVDENTMRRMATETGGKYNHARNDQSLFEIFEKLSIDLHDEGIDESTLRQLAERTDGKYYPARDISRLRFIYQGLAEDLQTTYIVRFPSLRQEDDGTSRDIDVSVWRHGVQVSDVLRRGYNVGGVVVPEMDSAVYLTVLCLLGGLLLLPASLRHLVRRPSAES